MPLTLRVRCDLVQPSPARGEGTVTTVGVRCTLYELTYPTSPKSGAMATNTVGVLACVIRRMPVGYGARETRAYATLPVRVASTASAAATPVR